MTMIEPVSARDGTPLLTRARPTAGDPCGSMLEAARIVDEMTAWPRDRMSGESIVARTTTLC